MPAPDHLTIALLAAGAGGMYCGSCIRDNALARALRRMGHDAVLVPLYTPVKTDDPSAAIEKVFFGGVNTYLQHASPLFRHTPRALDWLLDRPWLLAWAGSRGAQASPAKLGEFTLDILRGQDGNTAKELRRLVAFLRDTLRPDVVSLPNLMFVGLAGPLRRELGVPVVCELTGEDIFLNALSDHHRARARDLIRANAAHVDRFVATSRYYADRMARYLDLPPERIEAVYPGISADYVKEGSGFGVLGLGRSDEATKRRSDEGAQEGSGFRVQGSARSDEGDAPVQASTADNGPRTTDASATADRRLPTVDSPTIGYLARVCPEKGLDRLIDAVLVLRRRPGFEAVRVRAAGYLGKANQAWYRDLEKRIAASPLAGSYEYLGEVDRDGKVRLLDSVDLLCVPTAYPEPKGLFVLEALARGTPVVLPHHGSFPELVERTGGGATAPPGDPAALADALERLLSDPEVRRRHGESGRAAVKQEFLDDHMAARFLELYRAAGAGTKSGAPTGADCQAVK